MATEKQIAANRRNAAKSTGPKSTAGKATVRFNSMRHGLTAQLPLLPDEDPEQLQLLREALFQELQPVGSLEENLADRFVHLTWRLQRLSKIETGLFLHLFCEEVLAREQHKAIEKSLGSQFMGLASVDDGVATEKVAEARQTMEGELALMGAAYRTDTQKSDALSKLLRYESTLEKSLFRALHELQRLQAQREGAVVLPPVAVDINVTND